MYTLKLGHLAEASLTALDNFLQTVGIYPSTEVAMKRVYEQCSWQWQEFEQSLREIKSMSDQMGSPQPIFAILNQGLYTDRPTDYSNPDEELQLYLDWYHQAEVSATQLGFYPINYQQEFAEQLKGEIMAANILDRHPSPKMHRIYAQKLFDVIVNYVEEGKMCDYDFVER